MPSSRPDKSYYESLSIGSNHKRRWMRTRFWYLAGAGLGFVGLFFLNQATFFNFPRRTKNKAVGENIPTLLSLRNASGQFISAKANPLYDRFKNASLYFDTSDEEYGTIVRFHTVATQHNNKSTSSPSLSDRSVACWDMSFLQQYQASTLVALRCVDTVRQLLTRTTSNTSPSHERHHIYELATVMQLQTTAQQSPQCSFSPWSIPVPSSIRVPYCQWIVLQDQPEQRMATNTRQSRSQHTRNESFIVMGISNIISMPTSPLNVHLAYRTDPTELAVQFSSVLDGTPVVELTFPSTDGEATTTTASSTTTRSFQGTTTSYTQSDLCQAPANETGPGQFQSPGYLHTVILTGLPMNADLAYRVGLETTPGLLTWREWVTTHSNVQAGGAAEPYTYLVYADQGCPVGGWDMASAWIDGLVQREHMVRSLHHFGDLAYAEGVAHQWDAWLTLLEPVSSRWPLMIAVGNHEYDYDLESSPNDPSGAKTSYHPVWGNFGLDSGGECAVPVVKRFQMPDTGNSVFWYSYDSGLVHTIVLSSEHDLGSKSDQHKWFRKDLEQVNRELTPWLVVELHRPLYEDEAYWSQNTVGIDMREEIENLLSDYQVDLVLSGHYHAYHKTCDGLYRSVCNNGGPMHVTIGTAGARLDETDVKIIDDATWTDKLILGSFGYGRVTVHNASSLHLEFVQHGVPGDPNGGRILDDFWLERQRR